jgi:hypothetical protein
MRGAIAIVAATLLAAAAVTAEEKQTATPAAESPRAAAPAAQSSNGVSFKRDVKQAWAQARADGRRAGQAIGEGARSFGRATRDAAVTGWRKVKAAFAD